MRLLWLISLLLCGAHGINVCYDSEWSLMHPPFEYAVCAKLYWLKEGCNVWAPPKQQTTKIAQRYPIQCDVAVATDPNEIIKLANAFPYHVPIFISTHETRFHHNAQMDSALKRAYNYPLYGVFSFSRFATVRVPWGSAIHTTHNRNYTEYADYSRVLWSAAVAVSNCEAYRIKIIESIAKLWPVVNYGKCKINAVENVASQNLEASLRKHAFYLAIENRMCADYITEKFWRTLKIGTIPIVLGADVSEYARIFPHFGVIPLADLSGPIELKKKLDQIKESPTTYNAYHRWREHTQIKYNFRDDVSNLEGPDMDRSYCTKMCTAMKRANSTTPFIYRYSSCFTKQEQQTFAQAWTSNKHTPTQSHD